MDADRILCFYERIAGLMNRMVDAARASEWDRLGQLESSCQIYIRTLKAANLDVAMTGELRDRRNRLITEVLRADAAIRDLTEPGMARLKPFLDLQPVPVALRRECKSPTRKTS
jgi:flagellar protein FliT